MDGETIRTIATGAAAVLAGFGGAGIAGWFNRKNTKTTIEAVKVQAELDRNQGHMQWLRDRKVKCYAEFLAQSSSAQKALAIIHTNDVNKIVQIKELVVLNSDELLILAPRHIYDAAIDVMNGITAIAQATEPNSDANARDAAYGGAYRTFIEKYTTLERLIPHDLGVEELTEADA
ncbi:hypothetical protein [Arthrobacter sp. B2a2-09]|uniref:hypothetical protein n=1 Tax=Arthrobacter sp. B2a2-09 TaxID=2952822 RepID=UPI0022CD541C|nr:hypothetical protein [Arthrobacter sp. B2a2-09]MCZ9880538.1 hypothetical protein [Arthrobacter sp. B2a2-09]